MFVTGSNGEINTYDYGVIEELNRKYKGVYTIDFSDNVSLVNEDKIEITISNDINVKNMDPESEASTIYYYNNKLYVATFNPVAHGNLFSFPVHYNKKHKKLYINNKNITKYKIGARVQGIGLISWKGKEYLICTQSIGITKSEFLVYEVNDKELTFLGRKYLDEIGLEGITIDENGYIVGIFENSSRGVIVIKISELLNQVSDSWLDYNPGNEFAAWIGGEVYKLKHK